MLLWSIAPGNIGIDFLRPQVRMETPPLPHTKWKTDKTSAAQICDWTFSQRKGSLSRDMAEEDGGIPGYVKPNYPPPYQPAPPPEVSNIMCMSHAAWHKQSDDWWLEENDSRWMLNQIYFMLVELNKTKILIFFSGSWPILSGAGGREAWAGSTTAGFKHDANDNKLASSKLR